MLQQRRRFSIRLHLGRGGIELGCNLDIQNAGGANELGPKSCIGFGGWLAPGSWGVSFEVAPSQRRVLLPAKSGEKKQQENQD
jgi:hypothetical protein